MKTDKVQKVTRAKEIMKISQSGSFVVFSCFRPVPPDLKYNMAQISLHKISYLETSLFLSVQRNTYCTCISTVMFTFKLT
jgi:hypothetical protein